MAHGDQVGGPFGAHNTGHLRDGQHVTLGDLAPLNLLQGFGRHQHPPLCRGHPLGGAFGTDINHPRPPGLVEVREFSHFPR